MKVLSIVFPGQLKSDYSPKLHRLRNRTHHMCSLYILVLVTVGCCLLAVAFK